MKKLHTAPDNVTWRGSSFSTEGDPAVEIAFLDHGGIAMRDSRDPAGAALIFTAEEWDAFLRGVDGSEFDRPA
jgi:hypothetical protein